jgi:hypothetical protein
MSRKGRRSLRVNRSKPEPKKPEVKFEQPATWAKGDRALIISEDKKSKFKATILQVGEKRARVKFDTGQIDVVKRAIMYNVPRCHNRWCHNERSVNSKFCEECLRKERSENRDLANIRDAHPIDRIGVDALQWTGDTVNFKFDVLDPVGDKLHIYGWYRRTKIMKTDEIVHAIDMWIVRNDVDYAVPTIAYSYDPRKDMRALNADICARLQQWLSANLNSKAATIDDLRQRAEHPTIGITRIETIDNLLLKLREFRDTAIRAGGKRLFEFKGNSGPAVHITIDVSNQSLLLKGKVPSLEMGGVYDVAKGGEVRRPAQMKVRASPENINALLKQLANVKGNKREERKIRGVLRQMGHKGGARAAQPEKQKHEKKKIKHKKGRRANA